MVQFCCGVHCFIQLENRKVSMPFIFKIFSYVVCTQWLKLYTYILKEFGIDVQQKNIPNQDHVWGEIELNENEIIIVDARCKFLCSIQKRIP